MEERGGLARTGRKKEGAGEEVARMTGKVSATQKFVGTVGKPDIGKMNAKKKKRGYVKLD